jgi:hypothetical protein
MDIPTQPTLSIMGAILKRRCSIFRGYESGFGAEEPTHEVRLPLITAYWGSFPAQPLAQTNPAPAGKIPRYTIAYASACMPIGSSSINRLNRRACLRPPQDPSTIGAREPAACSCNRAPLKGSVPSLRDEASRSAFDRRYICAMCARCPLSKGLMTIGADLVGAAMCSTR